MNRNERRAREAQQRNVTKLQRIQIGYNPEKTKVALVTNEHTYSWPTEAMSGLITALRACAAGEIHDGCGGMVYAKGDKVYLTDNAARFFVVTDAADTAGLGMTYAMPRREATRMADGFEKTLRDMGV